ncbi:SDR family NAD(P)-dependent oxidoreductase [uncultured Jatrophihabitans sp.]|uniref:SDR family NAD(P)-dependent oxidoreductase n=1 Tax=uncultured Jatrophihabitans sp. TaxID=1610747 RepID=UPI0035CAAA9E
MTGEPARVVIVTGGSKGLGLGLVQSFLDSGARVATCARAASDQITRWQDDSETAERFLFRTADLSSRPDTQDFVAAVIEKWGRIDVLINNAGVAREGVLALSEDDDLDVVVDLNIKGTIYMTRLVSRRMLANRSGAIVNISSIVGRSGYRGLAIYSATKAALDGFTRAMARELGSRGITVNSIAPGYLTTELSSTLAPSQLKQIVRRTPLGRLGDAEDVARVAQFLVDPANTFITGQVIVVDGGLTG